MNFVLRTFATVIGLAVSVATAVTMAGTLATVFGTALAVAFAAVLGADIYSRVKYRESLKTLYAIIEETDRVAEEEEKEEGV